MLRVKRGEKEKGDPATTGKRHEERRTGMRRWRPHHLTDKGRRRAASLFLKDYVDRPNRGICSAARRKTLPSKNRFISPKKG